MKKVTLIIIALLIGLETFALAVGDLKVNSLHNPQCIDNSPSFSWILSSSEIDVCQTAYKITLFGNVEYTDILFESDVIQSSQSVDVKLNNIQLLPATRYYWRVTVYDNHGNIATSNECSYFDTGLMGTGWSDAIWIKGEEGEGVPYFRKSFTISKKIKSAMLFSSALGIYDIYINGERCFVLNKEGDKEYDILKPGNTEYLKRVFYNGHDITSLLRDEGENVIGAFVASGWWNGKIAHWKYGNPENALICKCIITYTDNSTETIVSDLTWQYCREMALRSSDIYDGEIYDARLEDNWKYPNYDSNKWKNVKQSEDFKGDIESFKGPIVKETKELSLKPIKITVYKENQETGSDFGMVNVISQYSQPTKIETKEGEHVVYDFGQNHSGWIHFKVKGEPGTILHIQFSEMLNDDGSLARHNDGPGGSLYLANLRSAKAEIYYTCSGNPDGENYAPLASYYGYRYCSITTTGKIEIDYAVSIPITSTPILRSEIVTDNSLVNQLFSNIIWGQRSNYISIPTDCPQRDERLGWLADTQLFCRTGMYNDDSKSFFHKWMQDLRDGQSQDGSVPATAPVIYDSKAAGWSDAVIIVPWQTYLMYGDTTIVAENFEAMNRYMDWLSKQHDGGIIYAGANTDFGDWLAPVSTDKRYVSMAYYAYDAQLMAKMARILSKDTPAYLQLEESYNNLYQTIRDEIQKVFFREGLPVQSTQTTYLLALAFNLFQDKEQRDKLIEGLDLLIADNNETLTTGFIGTALLNTTLSECGLSDRAYGLLLQRKYPSWLYSVDQGSTTMWERWDSYTKENGFGDEGMNSFNHYAYGAVGEWMYRYMLGIEVDEEMPGYKKIVLQPQADMRTTIPPGQSVIKSCSGIYESQYGSIVVSWDLDENNKRNYHFIVPANTTAKLRLPLDDASSLTVLNYFGGDEGVQYIGKEGECCVYSLKSGEYYAKSSKTTELSETFTDDSFDIVITDDKLKVNGVAKEMTIYDVHGRMISKSKGDVLEVGHTTLGIYLIRIDTGDTIIIRKISIR